jgi:hypothetical protein
MNGTSLSMSGTSLSMSGNNVFNHNSMIGKTVSFNTDFVSSDTRKLKIIILNDIIIPILSGQWKKLTENLLFLDKIKKNIDFCYEKYNSDDLLMYKEVIRAIEIMISDHTKLEHLERKMGMVPSTDLQDITYRTKTQIKLKPEYEVYDAIIGRPVIKNNEKYNDIVIKDIERLLRYNNVDFNKIKNFITNKYGKS